MHHDLEGQPQRLDEEMPLAAVHLLAALVATRTALLGRFDGLAGADRRTGRRLALGLPADLLAQERLEVGPGAVQPPTPEVVKGGRPGPVLPGQRAPGAATASEGSSCRSRIRRRSTPRGRPPGLAGGSRGLRMTHSESVRSLG